VLSAIVACKTKTANYNVKFNKVTNSPARVVQWSYHLGAMCSRAWHAQWPQSGVQSELRPGKARLYRLFNGLTANDCWHRMYWSQQRSLSLGKRLMLAETVAQTHRQALLIFIHRLLLHFLFQVSRVSWFPSFFFLRFHLSYDDSLEDKKENYQNCSAPCYVRQLCTRICTHTHEQFLKMSVGLGLGLAFCVFFSGLA